MGQTGLIIMKIVFDGQLFLKGNKTGIAWNAHHMIQELAKYPENECIIQCFAWNYEKGQLQRLEGYRESGCRIECCRWFKNAWYKYLWAVFPMPYHFFFPTQADITQFFNFAVPPGVRGKRVTVIHDMAYRSCPQTVHKKTRIWLELTMKKTCRHADHILTVSRFSKREIMKYLHVPGEKITVVPNAVDHAVYHPGYTKSRIQQVRDRFRIEKDYFLYLGTIEPRKNLERLIGAYAKLCRVMKQVPQLVLAGQKGWLCERIYEKARRLDMGNRILFTGYDSERDSPALMCGAKVFLFPSLYEGFGMPLLEAMACGTPVIASNTTALPEVAGGAGILVDPKSETQICKAMQRMLMDDECRRECRRCGLERAAAYTWAGSAEKVMDVYRRLHHGSV